VHCAEGTVDLYQDLVHGTWHVAHVSVLPSCGQYVHRLAPARRW
jgi:hypothetical protein